MATPSKRGILVEINMGGESAAPAPAIAQKLATSPRSTKKADLDSRLKEAENRRTEHLESVKAKASTKQVSPPRSPRSRAELDERLREAEIRRDIELDAVRFKAASFSAKKKKKGVVKVAKEDIDAKLTAAEQRRGEVLSARKAKASSCASPKTKRAAPAKADGAKLDARLKEAEARREAHLSAKKAKASSGASSPKKEALGSSSPTKASIEERLVSASARKQAHLLTKLDVASVASERVEQARARRLEAEQRLAEARRLELDASLAQAEVNKAAAVEESKAFSKAVSLKVENAAAKLADEQLTKDLALKARLQRAENLRADQEAVVVEKASIASAKVQRAQAERELADAAALEARLDNYAMKDDLATARLLNIQADKVIKAASLGSSAVAAAAAKKAALDEEAQFLKAQRLSQKLAAADERKAAQLLEVQEKAAKETAKAAEAQRNVALDKEILGELHEVKIAAAEVRAAEVREQKVNTAKFMGSERIKLAEQRRQASTREVDGGERSAEGTGHVANCVNTSAFSGFLKFIGLA